MVRPSSPPFDAAAKMAYKVGFQFALMV